MFWLKYIPRVDSNWKSIEFMIKEMTINESLLKGSPEQCFSMGLGLEANNCSQNCFFILSFWL